ncbi:flavin reductase family protein [Arenimonas sp.]|uniref:flavin reductase family protein n=1 Tax=Arenimonas sp. TaxID=1872635 RepID=UPI0037BEA359
MLPLAPAMFWQSPWLKPLNDTTAWNTLLQGINATWSLTEVRARVLRTVQECREVVSVYLKPNRLFKGFTPGQHLMLTLPCKGVLQSRSFSLSQAPESGGVLRLTIKLKADGMVSRAVAKLKRGAVVILSQAGGEFTHANPEAGVLLLSAGSGITPMVAMLQAWAKHESRPDVLMIHSCRNESDWILRQDLQTLVHQWPQLKIRPVFTAAEGRLDPERLQALAPDFALRDTLLCGPEDFMEWIAAFYREQGLSRQLKQEHFQARRTEIRPDATRYQVFSADGRAVFDTRNGQSLLEAAEASGLNPVYGCRRGICKTCTCRKLGGTVRNQLTETLSGSGEEWIQLCVSTPVSDLHLEL